jgi:hypothetical protein
MAGANTLPILSLRRTQRGGSDTDQLIVQFNRLATLVSWMMPGVLTSDAASSKGSSAATAWKTAAFTFTFRGLNVSAASQEKALTATTHDVAASKEAWYVLSVQTDGTSFTITKAADQTIGTVVLPTIPDNQIPVSYMQITTGSGGIFDASTDDLAVSGTSTGIATIAWTDAPYVSLIGNLRGAQRTATA